MSLFHTRNLVADFLQGKCDLGGKRPFCVFETPSGLFLSDQRPQLYKKFSATRTSHFGDMGIKTSTFPPLPKIGSTDPLRYFARFILGNDSQNPNNFVKISRPVSEIFGILLSEPMARELCRQPAFVLVNNVSNADSFFTLKQARFYVGTGQLPPPQHELSLAPQ